MLFWKVLTFVQKLFVLDPTILCRLFLLVLLRKCHFLISLLRFNLTESRFGWWQFAILLLFLFLNLITTLSFFIISLLRLLNVILGGYEDIFIDFYLVFLWKFFLHFWLLYWNSLAFLWLRSYGISLTALWVLTVKSWGYLTFFCFFLVFV